jgi:hypothetical protein
MIAQPQCDGWRRIVHEFTALGVWALATYAFLSLVSHDTGCELNLGGPLGDAFARALEHAFGYVGYVLGRVLFRP